MNSDIERAFKNIIKGVGDTRPVLQCVHFEDGNATATDTHRAFRVRSIVPKELVMDLNLAEFTFPEVNYPSMDAFFNRNPLTEFDMTVPLLRNVLPTIKTMIPGFRDAIMLEITEDALTFKSASTYMNQKIQLSIDDFEGKRLKIACSHKYLVDAIQAVTSGKFYGQVHFKLGTDLQPFLLTHDNLDYLITPVRVFTD